MPEITFTCSDDDAAWLAEQAQSLGIDDIGITVRVVVRNARQRNQSFGIVANGYGSSPAQDYAPAVSPRFHAVPQQRVERAAATAAIENEPAQDLEMPPDDVAEALEEASATIGEALNEPAPLAQPSSRYRQQARALRSQPALRVLDGPGSRTQALARGEMLSTDPRHLDAKSGAAVAAANFRAEGHFAGLRR
jgi:hypothetical protein